MSPGCSTPRRMRQRGQWRRTCPVLLRPSARGRRSCVVPRHALCRAGEQIVPAPMTRDEREEFLAAIHVGVLSADEPGRGPLSVPVWYLYEAGGEIVIVTRPE